MLDWIADVWSWFNTELNAGLIGAFIGAAISSGFSALRETTTYRRQREKEIRDGQLALVMELQDYVVKVAQVVSVVEQRRELRANSTKEDEANFEAAVEAVRAMSDRVDLVQDRLQDERLIVHTRAFLFECQDMFGSMAFPSDPEAFEDKPPYFKDLYEPYRTKLRAYYRQLS